MFKTVQFDSGLAACMHSLCDHIFFSEIPSFCCVQERFKPKQSVLFSRTKPDHLQMESLQRFNLLLRSLVLVLTRFGLACFSSTKTIRDSNQNASAQVVFFQSNQLMSGAVTNQPKPNTSGCEPEKRM